MNPLRKVPLLFLDDAIPLYDSRVMVEYRDSAAASDGLIPPNGRERLTGHRWEAPTDARTDSSCPRLTREHALSRTTKP